MSENWWERTGNMVSYPNLLQGNLPHCVYAAIAGGVNHLVGQPLWTAQSLFDAYQRSGPKDAHFGVADTAIEPVSATIEKLHHNRESSQSTLTPSLLRSWLSDHSVVILSMELRNDSVSKQGGWHMFSIIAAEQDKFQVWDTNGYQGFLTEAEVTSGFYYPNRWYFMPHDKEDALVLKLKSDRRQ